jgi:hypothetical protein
MGKTVINLQEKAKRADAVTRKLHKAEERLEDYELKFELMGLRPNIKFSECVSFREKIYGPALAEMEEPTALERGKEEMESTYNPIVKGIKMK